MSRFGKNCSERLIIAVELNKGGYKILNAALYLYMQCNFFLFNVENFCFLCAYCLRTNVRFRGIRKINLFLQ